MGNLAFQVLWNTQGDDLKKTKLHQGLFGRSFKRKDRHFYYDGILSGYKDGRKVKLVDWEWFGPRNLCVCAEVCKPIRLLLDNLDIDGRIIDYDQKHNYSIKRGTSLVSTVAIQTEKAISKKAVVTLKPGQANMTDFIF